jgi:hypothetical protein
MMCIDRVRMLCMLCGMMKPRNIPMPDSLLVAVDRWRALQPDLPNRSEAIRRLLTAQLRAHGIEDTESDGK